MDWVSVADAARELQLSEQQVRRLVGDGSLSARRFPGGWLVDERAVLRRAEGAPSAGRPPSAAMCWRLISAVSRQIESARGPGNPVGSAWAEIVDRKVRYRMRQLLADAPPAEQWSSWLRRRGEPKRVWVHPGVLPRLADDPRLHAGSGSAAVAAAAGLAVSNVGRLYLGEADFAGVMADYRARLDDEGQIELLLVPLAVSDALPIDAAPAPLGAGLLDLLESPDARAKHAAADLLKAAAAGLAASA